MKYEMGRFCAEDGIIGQKNISAKEEMEQSE